MGRLRFRRSEGIPIPVKIQRPRGRPIGWHKQDGVFTTIRVTGNLKEILDLEHRPGGKIQRYSTKNVVRKNTENSSINTGE